MSGQHTFEAYFAHMLLLLGMHEYHVLVEVCFLGKALATVNFFAYEGSLLCVHAQVIEEIMKFPEEFVTPFVVAHQDLDESLGHWVFVLVDGEVSRIGNFFLDPYMLAIELFSFYYLDQGVGRNNLLDLDIGNGFSLYEVLRLLVLDGVAFSFL